MLWEKPNNLKPLTLALAFGPRYANGHATRMATRARSTLNLNPRDSNPRGILKKKWINSSNIHRNLICF
ncbi:MAG: hypothetical protein F6J98_18010 [Moorea sp. SIO4G2]|nr:hypothetical protein [Moorena sp. SIO4G2]